MESPSVPAKSRLSGQRRLVIGLGVLVLVLVAVSLTRTDNRVADTGGNNNVVPPPWQPAGFTLSTDQTVAYRWLKAAEFDCDIADRCWGMLVVPKAGCSSLYVELAILDDAGTNVGYTNDSASGVAAGQQAKLVFDNFEDGASKAQVSKVSCL